MSNQDESQEVQQDAQQKVAGEENNSDETKRALDWLEEGVVDMRRIGDVVFTIHDTSRGREGYTNTFMCEAEHDPADQWNMTIDGPFWVKRDENGKPQIRFNSKVYGGPNIDTREKLEAFLEGVETVESKKELAEWASRYWPDEEACK